MTSTTSLNPVNSHELDLFGFASLSTTPKLKCVECGGLFFPSRGAANSQKFCGTKCRGKFYHRKSDPAREAFLDRMNNGEIPPPELTDPKDIEAVSLFKSGKSWKWIATLQDRNPGIIRRLLKSQGLYRPDPKHNGCAIRETLTHGTWRRRAAALRAAGAEVFFPKKIEPKFSNKRNIASKLLWAMRRGENVVGYLKKNDICSRSSVYSFLSSRKSYKKLRAKLKPKTPSLEVHRRSGFVSRQWANEYIFQDSVESAITNWGFPYKREYLVGNTKCRADFYVCGFCIECKTNVRLKEAGIALAQVQLYKRYGHRSIVLIPDDVCMHVDMASMISEHASIITLKDFPNWLASMGATNSSDVRTKQHGRLKIECKCCGQIKTPSQSEKGYTRSYCIDCEPIVKHKTFNNITGRWS